MSFNEIASDSARYVFVTAFTFLSSLTLQKVFNTLWDKLTEKWPKDKFYAVVLSQVALFVLVFAIAIIAAVFWVNYGEAVV